MVKMGSVEDSRYRHGICSWCEFHVGFDGGNHKVIGRFFHDTFTAFLMRVDAFQIITLTTTAGSASLVTLLLSPTAVQTSCFRPENLFLFKGYLFKVCIAGFISRGRFGKHRLRRP